MMMKAERLFQYDLTRLLWVGSLLFLIVYSGDVFAQNEKIDGLINGHYLYFDKAGNLMKECPKDRRLLDGTLITFSSKGDTISIVQYTQGSYDGNFFAFHKNRRLREATFSDGKINGRFTFYYKNGKKRSDVVYKNGCLLTSQRIYRKNGSVKFMYVPNSTRDRYALKTVFNSSGQEKSNTFINTIPETIYLFGEKYHGRCDAMCEPIP